MTLPGFTILVLLVLIGLWVFVELARLPGAKARERAHPQSEAIHVLGWLGLPFGGVPWLIALVWAYKTPLQAERAPMNIESGGLPEESANG